jgi:spore coat protein U-like protein
MSRPLHRRKPARTGLLLALAMTGLPGIATVEAAGGTSVRTTTFVVSVVVDSDCQLSGATTLDFGHLRAPLSGSVVAQSAGTDQLGHFNVSCSRNTRYILYLDRGNVPGSSIALRLMSGGLPGNSDRLRYQLYLDPSFSTVWGDGSAGGADGLAGTGTGAAQVYTVYGRILPQELPTPDLYSSIITASLTF